MNVGIRRASPEQASTLTELALAAKRVGRVDSKPAGRKLPVLVVDLTLARSRGTRSLSEKPAEDAPVSRTGS